MKKEEKIMLWVTLILFAVSFVLIFEAFKCLFDYFAILKIEMSKQNTVEIVKTIYVEVPVEVESEPTEEDSNYIINDFNYIIDVTDDEIELLARVIMSEASICDLSTKYCVGQTVVNRVISDKFPDNLTEVVYQENAYSTQDNGEPDEDCYKAAEYALTYQLMPTNTYYFRTDHYHTFGKPLLNIGNVYFSTDY